MGDLTKRVKEARRAQERGQSEAAMLIANELVREFSSDEDGWVLRAGLYESRGLRNEANLDLDQAIKLNPTERLYLFRRAFNHLQLGNWQSAVADCTVGLAITPSTTLGDGALQSQYYSDIFHLFRAEALLSLGQKDRAKADLKSITFEVGSNVWTNQLRTIRQLMELCD